MLGGLVPRRLCARPTRFLSLALFVISLFWILSNRSLGDIRALERPAVVQSPAWHAGAGVEGILQDPMTGTWKACEGMLSWCP